MTDARRTAEARRTAALERVRSMGEFCVEDLMKRVGLPVATARSYIRRWQDDGAIVLSRKDDRIRYYIAAEQRVDLVTVAQDVKTPEGNMWRAMRQYRQFSPLDITLVSNAGGVEVSIEKARSYCRALLEAGYLKVIDRAVPGRREAMYRLIANTGPDAPVVRRVSVLHDPNTDEFLPQGRRARA
ncbi:helix-turn-helix domain-containing protein [Citreimonas salinaria]|uniref:Uncharacterized protein n=1 Tax=Citreimonas salinaria TaxID=321339 RepID=A0A1H3KRS7_9RHOB|nr:helix-turn-helix domain-containing protein [Citreimonas salinaria]SDY54872.1 hypothetical protein SAMN05444340_11071 [Citreimonas salinaria]